MSTFCKTVRVFISSTFRDMHAERDHLVTVVFPELRERVERLGLEFFDVDLRWGVPAKDVNGETANSWEYCRQWIDRVEPFFVCILGQRYGWVPEPEQLKATEDSQRQQVEKRSITDMEVRHAVLSTKLKRRSYFYLRATDAPATASEYVDPPPLLRKLEQLKKEVRACGRPVRDYPCEWTGSGFAGMEEFDRRALDDLWSGVLRDERYVSKEVWRQVLGTDPDTDPRYTDESQPVPRELWEKIVALAKPKPKEPLDAEREQMDAFAASRLRWFQGRTKELKQLTDFLLSTATDAPRLAVVAAVPGEGKSALLAKLSTLSQASTFLITHFVGATERSASAHALVERLLGELDRSDIIWPAEQQEEGQEPKRDFNSLCLRLAQRLGGYSGERRIVILLDALNQLSDGHDLHWLPARLGPGVRVIVSCVEDAEAKADSPEQQVMLGFASRRPVPLRVPLGPLTEDDVRAIVVAYLKEYCHELDREHLDTPCAITQARNPLYLLVMLNELRTLGGNELNRVVPARIASMPQDHPDTVSLFRWVLQRLEVFGQEAVRLWCLYLAHGRVGMASHELADLLARKLGADSAATALRIERGLRRYLQRRGPQLDFFHGQLRQAVFDQYGPQVEATNMHSDIATYFCELADPERNQSWKGHSPRPFSELPFHLVRGRLWPELISTLEDIFFLEAKVAFDQSYDLVKDFSDATQHLPSNHPQHHILSLLEVALRRDLVFITRHAKHYPQGLFQCLWNLCWWHDSMEAAQKNVESGSKATTPSPSWQRNRPKLSKLLEQWRVELRTRSPSLRWVRLLTTHPLPLRSRLHARLPNASYASSVKRIKISSDGTLLGVLLADSLRIWDTARFEEMFVIQRQVDELGVEPNQHGEVYSSWGPFNEFGDVAFSPNGKTLVASFANHLRFIDLPSGHECARVIDGHADVTILCYANQTPFGAYASVDGKVRIWSDSRQPQTRLFFHHSRPIEFLQFSPDDTQLATVSTDGEMRLWDIASGECRFREILHGTQRKNFPEKVSFLPDGKGIALLGSDGRVRIRSISSGEERWVMDFPGATATGFAMSSDGSVIAIAGVRQNGTPRFGQYAEPVDTEIVVVQTQTGAIISRVAGQFWEPVMSFSPDGRFLSVRTISNGLRVWDVSESETSPQLVLALDIESLIEFFPKGRYAVTAGADNYANIWDLTKFDEGADVADDMESINGVAFGPDGGLAVSHRDSSAPENYWRSWGDRIPDQAMDQWRDRASAFQRVFQAESGTSELLIRRRGDGTPIAWLPLSVKDLQEHPFAHIWAGIQGGHLVVFELSDNSDTETKYGPDDTIHCA